MQMNLEFQWNTWLTLDKLINIITSLLAKRPRSALPREDALENFIQRDETSLLRHALKIRPFFGLSLRLSRDEEILKNYYSILELGQPEVILWWCISSHCHSLQNCAKFVFLVKVILFFLDAWLVCKIKIAVVLLRNV